MNINNLKNHLNHLDLPYIQTNNTTIVFNIITSPQLEVLPFTSEIIGGNDVMYVFDFNNQNKQELEYNPSIGQSIDNIINRQGFDLCIKTGKTL